MAQYRVLIVDDQHDVRQVLRAGLETLGLDLQVVDVPSGEEAMLLIAVQPFDVLVADVRLPGISGLELKERAKYQSPQLKLILITGMQDPKIRDQVNAAGADFVFFKPVGMTDFLEAIQQCLGTVPGEPEPAAEEETSVEQELTLAQRLSGLRKDLGAKSLVLLDERGQLIALAGDPIATESEQAYYPAVLALLSAGAKISHALGNALPKGVSFFSGPEEMLLATPVGSSLALLSLLESRPDKVNLGRAEGLLQAGVSDLLEIFSRMGVPIREQADSGVSGPVPTQNVEESVLDEAGLEDLDRLFRMASEEQLQRSEVEAFWEAAVEENDQRGNPRGDALSYEQAQRLGLTPDAPE